MDTPFQKYVELGLRFTSDPNDSLPLTRSDLECLQSEFGYPIPALYGEFLLRHGNSSFQSAWLDPPSLWVEMTEGASTDIKGFFGLTQGLDRDIRPEILLSRKEFKLPDHLLPIAASEGARTTVYISCRKSDFGRIYALGVLQKWKFQDGEYSDEEICAGSFTLAESFEQFLDQLRIGSRSAPQNDGTTDPVSNAMRTNHMNFIRHLVQSGAAKSMGSDSGLSFLETAVLSGKGWPVEIALENQEPTDRAFWMAIRGNKVQGLRALLAHGANPNAVNTFFAECETGDSALMEVVQFGDYETKYEMAQILVGAGADTKFRNRLGKTALDCVSEHNHALRAILMSGDRTDRCGA